MRAGRDVPVPERSKGGAARVPEAAGETGGAGDARVRGSARRDARRPARARRGAYGPCSSRPARDAVGQWEFVPTVLNDQPIPVAMSLTFNFSAARRAGGRSRARRDQCDIQEPKKIKDVRPVYPREALAKRQSGLVILEAVINPLGR